MWAYFCYLVFLKRSRDQSIFQNLIKHLSQNDLLAQALKEVGLELKLGQYQIIRLALVFSFMISAAYPLVLGSVGMTSMVLVMLSLFVYFLSSYSGLKWLWGMKNKLLQKQAQRDGELIAFARMYEMQRKTHPVQLATFCKSIAPQLPIIKNDLLLFSQRLTAEGDEAYVWFRSRLHSTHPFAEKLILGIRALETGGNSGNHLAEFLDKVAQDHFARKKKMYAPFFNTITALPTIMVIVMILVLLFQFIMITKNNLFM